MRRCKVVRHKRTAPLVQVSRLARLQRQCMELRQALDPQTGLARHMREKMDAMREQLNDIVALLPKNHVALPMQTHRVPTEPVPGFGYRVPVQEQGLLRFRDVDDMKDHTFKVNQLRTWILTVERSDLERSTAVRLISLKGEVAFALSDYAARSLDRRELARKLVQTIAPDMVTKMLEKMND